MKTPEQILEIATDNGFDWFGLSKETWPTLKYVALDRQIQPVSKGEVFGFRKSLADLACNKSFIEALVKIRGGKEWHEKFFNLDLEIQRALINDLTNNDGSEFWNIISEFIGEKQ